MQFNFDYTRLQNVVKEKHRKSDHFLQEIKKNHSKVAINFHFISSPSKPFFRSLIIFIHKIAAAHGKKDHDNNNRVVSMH